MDVDSGMTGSRGNDEAGLAFIGGAGFALGRGVRLDT